MPRVPQCLTDSRACLSVKFNAFCTLPQIKFPSNWPDIQRRCGFWRLNYRNGGFTSKNNCVFLTVAALLCSSLVWTLRSFPPGTGTAAGRGRSDLLQA